MILFAIGALLLWLSTVAAAFWIGLEWERATWKRRLDFPPCWRCGGTGADRDPRTRRRARWADQ